MTKFNTFERGASLKRRRTGFVPFMGAGNVKQFSDFQVFSTARSKKSVPYDFESLQLEI
jgi:hypothetical protein